MFTFSINAITALMFFKMTRLLFVFFFFFTHLTVCIPFCKPILNLKFVFGCFEASVVSGVEFQLKQSLK